MLYENTLLMLLKESVFRHEGDLLTPAEGGETYPAFEPAPGANELTE